MNKSTYICMFLDLNNNNIGVLGLALIKQLIHPQSHKILLSCMYAWFVGFWGFWTNQDFGPTDHKVQTLVRRNSGVKQFPLFLWLNKTRIMLYVNSLEFVFFFNFLLSSTPWHLCQNSSKLNLYLVIFIIFLQAVNWSKFTWFRC